MCGDPYDAAYGADVLLLITEWLEFRTIDPTTLAMRRRFIVDTRNVLDVETLVENGFTVASIGMPTHTPAP